MIFGMTKAAFLADPVAAIKNAEVIPVGNTRTPHSRLQFNFAQIQSEALATQTATIDNLDTIVANRYMCTQDVVNATSCHVNNGGPYVPSFGYTLGGDIYISATDSSSAVSFARAEILGTFDVANSTCQPYATSSLLYVPNTDPRTQGWLNINGIGTAQNDGGKLVWQVNDAGTGG